jgi:lipopolysaccharide/colanic/teichoic acid biosynthesis glycosyltransferase
MELVGLVDDAPRERRVDLAELTILGPAEALWDIVREHTIERVIVAYSNQETSQTLAIMRQLAASGIRIDVVPRLFEAIPPRSTVDDVEGLALLSSPVIEGDRRAYRVAKRALDVAVASILILATMPLMAFIAWRVKRDSPGPVLFRQTRCGEGMREFTSLKFRTMRTGTPAAVHREYIEASMAGALKPEAGGLFKLTQHDAITRSGWWLRNSSLDELPQLFNVLRGDMSLVGPRPCIPYETEFFEPHHFERFSVPGGLTGLWQTSARAHGTFREALELDVAYARSCSFPYDLRLLLATPQSLLSRKSTR